MLEVVAALIMDGDRFFICQRSKGRARGGLWEFPGGKVEAGETPGQALERECLEELGVHVLVGDAFSDVRYDYGDVAIHLTLFFCAIAKGSLQRLEHEDIRFIFPSEADQYAFCPADRIFVDRLCKKSEKENVALPTSADGEKRK